MPHSDTQKIDAYLDIINAKQRQRNRQRMMLMVATFVVLAIGATTLFALDLVPMGTSSQEITAKPFEQAVAQVQLAQEDTAVFFASRSFEAEEFVSSPDDALIVSDRMPRFPGGDDEMYYFIKENIQFPTDAKNHGIHGRVYLRFIVEADGRITNIEVIRGAGYGFDEEAIRILEIMPNWEPGLMRGEYVPVYSSIAVDFRSL